MKTADNRTLFVPKKQVFSLKWLLTTVAAIALPATASLAVAKPAESSKECYIALATFPQVKMTGSKAGKTWDAFSFGGVHSRRSNPDILMVVDGKSLPVCKNVDQCSRIISVVGDSVAMSLFDADAIDHDPAGHNSECKPSTGRCDFGKAGTKVVFTKTQCQ